MHPQVAEFFQIHLAWLTGVIVEGVAAGALRTNISPNQVAMLLLSTLEGGSFVGWAIARKEPVLAAFETALQNLEAPSPSP